MLWQSVFLQEWEQCLENLGALGVFIEVLPTIIVKQSSFLLFWVFLKFYLFIFLLFCYGWKRRSDEIAWTKCIIPSFCSLPLEIIPVYFGNGSQRPCCHSYLCSDGLWLNYMQIFWCLWIQNGEHREEHNFSVCFLSVLSLAVSSCISVVCCDVHSVKVWARSRRVTLACEHYNCNRGVIANLLQLQVLLWHPWALDPTQTAAWSHFIPPALKCTNDNELKRYWQTPKPKVWPFKWSWTVLERCYPTLIQTYSSKLRLMTVFFYIAGLLYSF